MQCHDNYMQTLISFESNSTETAYIYTTPVVEIKSAALWYITDIPGKLWYITDIPRFVHGYAYHI